MWVSHEKEGARSPYRTSFQPIKENIMILEKWIIETYRSLVFNQCTCQVLLVVDSLPLLNLLVNPSVKPTAIHKPSQVPLHFMDEVREGLEKDVCLGVLESFPENTPLLGVAGCV